ncbi:DUF5805 domain-containing protein [Haloarchaeobius sp. DFWS5]|uniref:DUF5805 domain-containing protein n=1 Tax=Haloarchaeobius sp. DFWS5 TaxID=3446114 RepID=UPI003EBF5C8B
MSDQDTTRSVVKTYVPAYQKDHWTDHADELDMSQSEFVRTMVQAGRQKFGLPESPDNGSTEGKTESISGDSERDGDTGGAMQQRVVSTLQSAEGAKSWEELLADVSDDVEARLDDALADLQSTGSVRYSGRDGGYVLTGE